VNPNPVAGNTVPGKALIASEQCDSVAIVGGGSRAIFDFLSESPVPAGSDALASPRDRMALVRQATDSSPPPSL
jgi:hypothetical protein